MVRREGLYLLGPFGLPGKGGIPLLPPSFSGRGFSSFSSLLSLEECAPVSSDDESGTMLRRELLLVPVAFFLAFFFGTS